MIGPNSYKINEMVLVCSIKLTKANGDPPEKNAMVAPVANVLHSLFESVMASILYRRSFVCLQFSSNNILLFCFVSQTHRRM
jgi:hypothetical protein